MNKAHTTQHKHLLSLHVTVKEQVVLRPAVSVTRRVTAVAPTGNCVVPETAEFVHPDIPALSVAVGDVHVLVQ